MAKTVSRKKKKVAKKTKKVNPVGRPTKYPSAKKDRLELCEGLVNHMAKGMSFHSYGGSPILKKIIGSFVALETMYNWIDAHGEFLESKKMGEQVSRHHWEKLGVDNILEIETRSSDGDSFKQKLNSTVWIFTMKNKFPKEWRDKHEHDVSAVVDKNVSITFNKKTEPDDD